MAASDTPKRAVRSKEKTAPQKQQTAASVRKEVVDLYVDRLNAVGLQRAEFDSLVDDLIRDKTARKSEVSSIAGAYVGVALSLPSRTAALEAIKRRFVEKLRFQRKIEIA